MRGLHCEPAVARLDEIRGQMSFMDVPAVVVGGGGGAVEQEVRVFFHVNHSRLAADQLDANLQSTEVDPVVGRNAVLFDGTWSARPERVRHAAAGYGSDDAVAYMPVTSPVPSAATPGAGSSGAAAEVDVEMADVVNPQAQAPAPVGRDVGCASGPVATRSSRLPVFFKMPPTPSGRLHLRRVQRAGSLQLAPERRGHTEPQCSEWRPCGAWVSRRARVPLRPPPHRKYASMTTVPHE